MAITERDVRQRATAEYKELSRKAKQELGVSGRGGLDRYVKMVQREAGVLKERTREENIKIESLSTPKRTEGEKQQLVGAVKKYGGAVQVSGAALKGVTQLKDVKVREEAEAKERELLQQEPTPQKQLSPEEKQILIQSIISGYDINTLKELRKIKEGTEKALIEGQKTISAAPEKSYIDKFLGIPEKLERKTQQEKSILKRQVYGLGVIGSGIVTGTLSPFLKPKETIQGVAAIFTNPTQVRAALSERARTSPATFLAETIGPTIVAGGISKGVANSRQPKIKSIKNIATAEKGQVIQYQLGKGRNIELGTFQTEVVVQRGWFKKPEVYTILGEEATLTQKLSKGTASIGYAPFEIKTPSGTIKYPGAAAWKTASKKVGGIKGPVIVSETQFQTSIAGKNIIGKKGVAKSYVELKPKGVVADSSKTAGISKILETEIIKKSGRVITKKSIEPGDIYTGVIKKQFEISPTSASVPFKKAVVYETGTIRGGG